MLHHKLNLIAFIRCGGSELNETEQEAMISEYCNTHNYHLSGIYLAENNLTNTVLTDAMKALASADGLIAVDLNRFVRHADDRLHDLAPLLNELIRHRKVLIAILDGIETVTPHGQKVAIDYANQWSDREGLMALPNTQ